MRYGECITLPSLINFSYPSSYKCTAGNQLENWDLISERRYWPNIPWLGWDHGLGWMRAHFSIWYPVSTFNFTLYLTIIGYVFAEAWATKGLSKEMIFKQFYLETNLTRHAMRQHVHRMKKRVKHHTQRRKQDGGLLEKKYLNAIVRPTNESSESRVLPEDPVTVEKKLMTTEQFWKNWWMKVIIIKILTTPYNV